MILPRPIQGIAAMGPFFWETFSEKNSICFLAPPTRISFLTISNEIIFLKTQDTRLGAKELKMYIIVRNELSINENTKRPET